MDELTATANLGVGINRSARDEAGPCESCNGPHARRWSTPQGAASLCPTCATLHGLGCP